LSGPTKTGERVYESDGVPATEQIGRDLAATLVGGECVALDGDLGAGKTQFVRGLVAGLGGDPRRVSSPTYILLHVYGDPARAATAEQPMRLTVYHLDAYRVGEDDLEGIGFSELLDQGGVVIVEWASRVARLLPERTIRVKIRVTGKESRQIVIAR
jgi:tRNA threonylcarbamoyladenosine biosynthesis protein TsaE